MLDSEPGEKREGMEWTDRGRSSGRSCRCFESCQHLSALIGRVSCDSIPRLRHQPVNSCQDIVSITSHVSLSSNKQTHIEVVPVWEVRRPWITVIAQDHLAARIAFVAAVGKKLGDVLDIWCSRQTGCSTTGWRKVAYPGGILSTRFEYRHSCSPLTKWSARLA